MNGAFLLVALANAVVTIPAPSPAPQEADVITYHCSDLVVIGRLENLSYEHVDSEDDLLGHGWITARVRVRRVLFGGPARDVVPLRYFAHTYRRGDVDLLFVINRSEGTEGILRSAHLVDHGRARLSRRCE